MLTVYFAAVIVIPAIFGIRNELEHSYKAPDVRIPLPAHDPVLERHMRKVRILHRNGMRLSEYDGDAS